ncbi:hypothetical protein [Pedobacter endophyticus]|uniref:Lipocalin-like domain-containing protein n=1 Tax=Pedobacter endophyticus TaxID=2789740 RepID=A0A7S9Q0W1_9SPHI|nr:hypothetical protein [Pedobacter endophyticus]QPH41196.1 hypothetical protein IZT61_08050 [Pedobacter endophyticus]
MTNKYLLAWLIPLLLLGASCKKQENPIQEEISKDIRKADFIGVWTPFKIETTFTDKQNQEVSIIDSTEKVKFYIPAYKFTYDKVIVDHNGWDYSVNTLGKTKTLEYLRYGVLQDYEILKLNASQLILKDINIEDTGKRVEIVYFNKN